MAKSWPEFYADYDGTKIFWKFWDFDQNNPVLKFDVFFAIISTWLHNYVPKFGLHGSFFTLNKMSQKDFEISKILQNLGMKSESRQFQLEMYYMHLRQFRMKFPSLLNKKLIGNVFKRVFQNELFRKCLICRPTSSS